MDDKGRTDAPGAPDDETPDWNTPDLGDEALPIAVRRVMASDRHISQRGVFFGHAVSDEAEPTTDDAAPGDAEAPGNASADQGDAPR